LRILKDQPIRRQVVAITCALLVPFVVAAAWSGNRSRIEHADELRDQAGPVAAIAGAVADGLLAGGVLLFPSLALLFALTLTGRLGEGHGVEEVGIASMPAASLAMPRAPRVAAACLFGGVGFLNVADAPWAHALGVVSLFAFIVTGFGAIVSRVVVDDS